MFGSSMKLSDANDIAFWLFSSYLLGLKGVDYRQVTSQMTTVRTQQMPHQLPMLSLKVHQIPAMHMILLHTVTGTTGTILEARMTMHQMTIQKIEVIPRHRIPAITVTRQQVIQQLPTRRLGANQIPTILITRFLGTMTEATTTILEASATVHHITRVMTPLHSHMTLTTTVTISQMPQQLPTQTLEVN